MRPRATESDSPVPGPVQAAPQGDDSADANAKSHSELSSDAKTLPSGGSGIAPKPGVPPVAAPLDAETLRSEAAVPAEQGNSDREESQSEDGGAEEPQSRRRLWHRLSEAIERRQTPAFLVSLILHTLAFLVLALLTFAGPVGLGERVDFQAASITDPDEATDVELLAVGEAPSKTSPTVDQSVNEATSTTQATTTQISRLLEVQAPRTAKQNLEGALDKILDTDALSLSASFASTGTEGRSPAKRRQTALRRGGSIESEQAVERALDWLAAHQMPSGAWSLLHDRGTCNGRCRNNGSKDRFDTAATGLALLAFLGAGYTHQEGKHRDTVRKGVYFLLQVIEETPEGGSFLYQSERGMYNHGIASFALCEAYQLTGDKDLRRAAQQAIDFTVAAQHYRGGWGYLPKQPGDLTLSGWQIMALKSAYAGGLDVPPSTILRIDPFLETQVSPSGVFFGYTKPGKNPTCTAIGLLVRLFRGVSHTDPNILSGAEYFHRQGRSNSDCYFNYYATLFLFHVGGPFWERWNQSMREYLIRTQSDQGHEAGSWYFDNPFGKEGGRLYTTAMCAMTLEVYYRFAPIYQQADEPFEL